MSGCVCMCAHTPTHKLIHVSAYLAGARACVRAYACIRIYRCTHTCAQRASIHNCARERVLLCVRVCACVRACGRRCRTCVAPCVLRACTCVRLCARIGVRVEPHADRHIDALVRVSESRVCPSVRPAPHCVDPVPTGHGRPAHADHRKKKRPAAAPVLVIRVHVGAVREQRRHRRRVPGPSGKTERRLPAAERARARPAARAVGACQWECARACVNLRACVCLCASARMCDVWMCVCVHVRTHTHTLTC
jgi:hypothetical protein